VTHRRIPLWLALVSLVTVLGACTDGGDSDDPESPSPGPATPEPTTFAEPPDGGTLEVAEVGFSESPRTTGDTSADLLSWGVVIENTSDEYLAVDGAVTVTLLDADGNPIDELSGEPASEPVPSLPTLTRLLPGERIGFGHTVPHYGADVADLAVEVEASFWQPVNASHWSAHPITATDVVTQRSGDRVTLGFTVNAAYTGDMVSGQLWVGGHFAAIFRDGSGAVIGGADCCHGTGGNNPVQVPPGLSQAELHLDFETPAPADDARTEIYLPDPRENLPG
jgi:hypothetical protein